MFLVTLKIDSSDLSYLRKEIKPGSDLLIPVWQVFRVICILQGTDLNTDGNRYSEAT
jgi:hypothetical protein